MKESLASGENPILNMDYPDPDVICVDNVFYMITTSMHFMPGGQILRSYDLIHWEHAAYVFDRLDSTDAQRLKGDGHVYGKGMWAASLRYHEGMFYVVFVCNDTQKTYLYRSDAIDGIWQKSTIEGFYHDCSLYFEDDRTYLVYGNTQIYLTELDRDLKGPKEGGLHRMIITDEGNPNLGYEGSHLYKIGGRYYLFLIHSKRDRWRRVEACFTATSLEGEFTGSDVYDEDLGIRDSGIAQGGIVEGPKGIWHAIMFQDSRAIGRIPAVIPVFWNGQDGDTQDPLPVFGRPDQADRMLQMQSFDPGHVYAPLYGNDDFSYDPETVFSTDKRGHGSFGFLSFWQFNHEPDLDLVGIDADSKALWIQTDKVVGTIFHAKNTLTQHMRFPGCSAEVTVDGSLMQDGDYAGIAAFQGDYLTIGIRKKNGKLYASAATYKNPSQDPWKLGEESPEVSDICEIEDGKLRIRLNALFDKKLASANSENGEKEDIASCGFYLDGEYREAVKEHQLRFRLDHFTGCRFALFMMSEERSGGKALFSDFVTEDIKLEE